MPLFRRKKKTPPPATRTKPAQGSVLRIRTRGLFAVPIVGESHYQDALEAAAGPRAHYRKHITDAIIIHDDDNPYSKTGMAIRIEIDGRCVGYLKRGHDANYRRWLSAQGHPGRTAVCRAKIMGGGKETGSQRLKYYGVWLDIPEEAIRR